MAPSGFVSGSGGFLQFHLDGQGALRDPPHHFARDVTDSPKIRLDGPQALQGGVITQEDGRELSIPNQRLLGPGRPHHHLHDQHHGRLPDHRLAQGRGQVTADRPAPHRRAGAAPRAMGSGGRPTALCASPAPSAR